MAQLLPPVCADTLKFRTPPQIFCSRNRVLIRNGVNWSRERGNSGVGGRIRANSSQDHAAEAADDYYAVLGLEPDATTEQIKKAYYSCMKACHPDLSGDDPETTNFCIFVNEIYAVLTDPVQRKIYDEIHGYAVSGINPFLDDSIPKDHVFVDEFTCIGCKNCANVCPEVFSIEEDFGRARAYCQIGVHDSVQAAVESCPVSCIHWTSAAQLSLLEDEMRRVERVNVALMLSGMGSTSVNVFRLASSRWEKRQAKVLQQARIRMMRTQRDSGKKTESYWSNLWGNARDNGTSEEEVEERTSRAAAAARRWREYSRKGVGKRPDFKLPEESISNKD
ncbi:chaperone protein dnaJ C76, chloroplastic-like [Andrographis paniculata]|uniref:chaperone protein dnaJ C76, chloroplastic-like n=1 Tax=Andrographis paniculata TaxID=175694 RepID=UPI0021E983CC|nr:chaperone protein dnaJ C76, chloroplastic-like [Andrographis paniculata]